MGCGHGFTGKGGEGGRLALALCGQGAAWKGQMTHGGLGRIDRTVAQRGQDRRRAGGRRQHRAGRPQKFDAKPRCVAIVKAFKEAQRPGHGFGRRLSGAVAGKDAKVLLRGRQIAAEHRPACGFGAGKGVPEILRQPIDRHGGLLQTLRQIGRETVTGGQ